MLLSVSFCIAFRRWVVGIIISGRSGRCTGYPKINAIATAIATPTKAPTGPATSAYSSSQSITAVNGFIFFPSVVVRIIISGRLGKCNYLTLKVFLILGIFRPAGDLAVIRPPTNPAGGLMSNAVRAWTNASTRSGDLPSPGIHEVIWDSRSAR
jgi:hypothetical protein